MEIYIICTLSESGRYVHDATTSPRRLDDEYKQLVAGLSADGWHTVKVQTITDPATDGRPRVVTVAHLRNERRKAPNDWLNVEVYTAPNEY